MRRDRLILTRDHAPCARFFTEEAPRVASALSSLVPTVEHIGSTAVPGLLAKPIVDIAVVVGAVGDLPAAVEPLVALGYRHRGQHGDDPLRRYFVLEVGGCRVAQLHLWVENGRAWREAMAFRDLLREREDLREAYAAEKLRVAEEEGWEKGAYSLAKGPFIVDALERWVR